VAQSLQQQEAVRALYHLTKALDPTRLVIGNDGWEHVVTDVLTVHDYSSDPAVLRERYADHEALEHTLGRLRPGYRSVVLPGTRREDEPVVLSEVGGFTVDVGADDTWLGYGVVGDAEALLESYRGLVDVLLDSTAIGGFCYTQLTDTVQEKNGLVTEDRRPKVDVSVLRAITTRTSAAVPADAVFAHEFGHEFVSWFGSESDEPDGSA